ncbi:conserved hypothetical protein [Klebsiella grimontii]|uniref:Uncharacterized protein n=1 Tax=Klebsiella grimontii TaxID=2058152 RepID=A0A285B9E7_9ENTR|nr:conserved hypothetical protein [Klebsiella grimontii]
MFPAVSQVEMDLAIAINATGLQPELFDLSCQLLFVDGRVRPVFLYPGIKTVGSDIETFCDTGNRMATINNLFDCFSFKLFRITLTAHVHLSLSYLNDSEVSVKPVSIQCVDLTPQITKP